MASIKYEIDRQVSNTEHSGVINISSSDVLPKCRHSSKKEVKLFAFHKTHMPAQRSSLTTEVNKGLVHNWVEIHKAKKGGASPLEIGAMLPAGQIVLGTINSKELSQSGKLVIVDGQQRISTLKAAEKVVGEPIEVALPAHFIDKSSPKELASHYMRYNTCNPMAKSDFVAGAICSGDMADFVDKIDRVRASGVLTGCDIGLRPSKEERQARHTFDYHQILTWTYYAATGRTTRTEMVKNANNLSFEAIERVCKIVAEFDRIIGYKLFRASKAGFHYKCYSTEAFMCAISRLALVEELDGKRWLDMQAVRFWFGVLQNTGHDKGVPTLGQEWWEYASSKTVGVTSAIDMYSAFLRNPEQTKSGRIVKKFGIAVAQPNERYTKKYARAGFGNSPEDGRSYFDHSSEEVS